MNLDKSLEINIRFADNIKIYNQNIKNKNDRETIVISVSILEDLLDKILKIKLAQSGDTILIVPKISYLSKVDLCYKMNMIGSSLQRTLQVYGSLVDNFTSLGNINNFGNLSIQTNILELCRLNNNDIFNLILEIISSDDKIYKKYSKIDDLIVDIGWSGVVKFISSIIQASLIEAYLDLK